MKKSILKPILVLFMLTSALTSCNNDDEITSPPTPPGLAEFLYAEGGASSFSSTINSVAISSSGEIFGRNGTTEVVKIKLPSLVVGFYEINSTNQFTYTRPSTTSPWVAFTGTIIITEVTSTTISGAFDLNSGNSDLGINSVSGIFNNVPFQP